MGAREALSDALKLGCSEADTSWVRGVKSLERVSKRGQDGAAAAGGGGAGPGSVGMTSSSGGILPGPFELQAAAPPVDCLIGLISEPVCQVARFAVSMGKSSGGLALSAPRFLELMSEAIAFMLAITEFSLKFVRDLLEIDTDLAEGVSAGRSHGESEVRDAASTRWVGGAGRGRRWTG